MRPRLDREGFVVAGESLCEPLQLRKRQPRLLSAIMNLGLKANALFEVNERVLKSILRPPSFVRSSVQVITGSRVSVRIARKVIAHEGA